MYSIIQRWLEDGEWCFHFVDGLSLEQARDLCLLENGVLDEIDISGWKKFYDSFETIETYRLPEGKEHFWAIIIPTSRK